MFLEALERRELLAVAPPGDDGAFSNFDGNIYPPSFYQAGQADYLTGPTSGTKLDIAIDYLKSNAGAFGLTANDFNHYQVTDQFTSDTGITHIYIQQTFNGLPVADTLASVNLSSNGRVLTAAASFVPGLNHPLLLTPLTPQVTALNAVNLFAYEAGLTDSFIQQVLSGPTGRSQKTTIRAPGFSTTTIPVELHYVPKEGGGVQLAWRMVLQVPNQPHVYEGSIGAEGDDAGYVVRVVDWVHHASYNVFPAPFRDPAEAAFQRTIAVNPHSPTASPLGWHNDGFVTYQDTRGNNVFAQEDINGDDLPGLRPFSGPTLDFDAPLTLPSNPASYTDAATLNAFYWANLSHDVAFHHGFSEAAGNMQVRNFSGKGNPGDPVIVDTQDPRAFFGAHIFVFPDGTSPRMELGIIPPPIPALEARDTALDGGVVAHEYMHAISIRLTSGPGNNTGLNRLQSGGMGEGWSDWFAVLLTLKPTDTRDTPQIIGDWVFEYWEPLFGTFGVRRVPYSFDMTVNPLRLGNYNGDLFPQQNNTEVHNSGEIWASALIDMTWLLIEKHGFSNDLYNGNGGQNVALRLVLEAMKLQPYNPTFTQARDAILAADLALYGGDNFTQIWTAFARRGFGIFATSGPNADSLVVNESFVMPRPPAQATGTVFQDINGNGRQDTGEPGLAGWTVYVDSNNNGVLDNGERRTVTDQTGGYGFNIVRNEELIIRQIVMPFFSQTSPTSNGGAHRVSVNPNQPVSGLDFGNREVGGEIRGLKFNDLNGNGVRDEGEPGIAGVVIYVDLNNDGRIGLMEPGAVTGSDGRYTIKNVQPGTYSVREVFQPGLVQTFPDPQGTAGGAHTGVVVARAQVTANIDFGNQAAFDFGDAPAPYPTLLAQNGARHGILPGFGLGPAGPDLVLAEADGQPHPQANAAADDNGVVIVGMTPGEMASAIVQVQTGGFSPGLLHGWIDWNRDGDWNDANEKIISNVRLGTGTHTIQFPVPAGASLGPVFARFRYGFEQNLGPAGAAQAGEVEDYVFDVLANVPVARDDFFGGSFGPPVVRQGSADNRLDVLANDFGITVGGQFSPPQIDLATLPASSSRGGVIEVEFDPALGRNVILYTPSPSVIGIDTFQYRVTAGGVLSGFATVTIDVSAPNPRALDDTFTITAGTGTPVSLTVLTNDVFPNPDTRIVGVQPETIGVSPGTLQIAPGGQTLNFTPPTAGFRGTLIYTYTIDDSDPNTLPSTARVTVQFVDTVGGVPVPAASHQAQLSAVILDSGGNPTSLINQGDDFFVEVIATDLRPGGNFFTRGVIAAYVDVLFNRDLAVPLDITFVGSPLPVYRLAQSYFPNDPAPGILNEVGGTYNNSAPNLPSPGNDVAVFRVRMRATGTGQLVMRLDPADVAPDGNDFSRILLVNEDPLANPIELTDEQVFLLASTATIVGAGEGEFTNARNPLDVSNDGFVTPLDVLMVVNDLNLYGGRALSQFGFATSGILPPNNFLDVNVDSFVTPLDALLVINHLNRLTAGDQGAGEAEAGEGEGAFVAAMGLDAEAGEGELAGDLGTSLVLQDQAIQSLLDELAAGDEKAGEQVELLPLETTSWKAPWTDRADTNDEDDEFSVVGSSTQTEDAADELFATLGLEPRLSSRRRLAR